MTRRADPRTMPDRKGTPTLCIHCGARLQPSRFGYVAKGRQYCDRHNTATKRRNPGYLG